MKQLSKKTVISLRDIFVRFDGEVILNHINLDIKEKEFVTILGTERLWKDHHTANYRRIC